MNFVSQRSLEHKEGLLRERIELKEPTHSSSDDLKRLAQKFSSIKQAVKEKRGVQVKAVGFFCNPNHQGAALQEEEEKVAFDSIKISYNSSNSVSNAEPSINQKREEEESKYELAEKLVRERVSSTNEEQQLDVDAE